jgi:hypothetical protein
MFASLRSFPYKSYGFALLVVAGVVLVSCAPKASHTAQMTPYDRAKEAFQTGDLDKALDLTEKLVKPPGEFTDRARVLRCLIFAGQLKAAKELTEAYAKGAEKTKDTETQAAYRRLQNEIQVRAAKAALSLAETAHQIVHGGAIAKEFVLEASFPAIEGPTEIKELAPVGKGDWIAPTEQHSALVDALRQGVDDALADVVAGDRAKARQALAAGSAKLGGADFAIFLAHELADGAVVFDRHHGLEPHRLAILCDQGEVSLDAAMTLLKNAPNKDQEKEIKSLADKFKTIRKDA